MPRMYIPFILSLSLSLTYFRAVCSRVRRVLQSPARLQRGFLALVGLWPSLTPLCGLAFSRYAVGSPGSPLLGVCAYRTKFISPSRS